MKKIEAYKHEPTGKIFESLDLYEKFEKQYEMGRIVAKEREERRNNLNLLVKEPRLEATSLKDFRERYINNWNLAWREHNISMKNVSMHVHWCKEGYWEGTISGDFFGYQGCSPCPKFDKLPPNMGEKMIEGIQVGGDVGYLGSTFRHNIRLVLIDFPKIQENLKYLLDRSYEIDKIKEEYAISSISWINRKHSYINTHPKIRQINSELEDIETKILKLSEAKNICMNSKSLTQNEAEKEFSSIDPFDFKDIAALDQELKLINQMLEDVG